MRNLPKTAVIHWVPLESCTQILGQLSEGINYQKLYSQALKDPQLERTEVELQAAMQNASDAREAVFELFQDLDGFSLDEYEPLSNTSKDVQLVTTFVKGAAETEGLSFIPTDFDDFKIEDRNNSNIFKFTPDRDRAQRDKYLELLGLDHPYVAGLLQKFTATPPSDIGIRVRSIDGRAGFLAVWRVETEGERRQRKNRLITIAVSRDGERIPSWERRPETIFGAPPVNGAASSQLTIFREIVEPTFERELRHKGMLDDEMSLQTELIAWVEVSI